MKNKINQGSKNNVLLNATAAAALSCASFALCAQDAAVPSPAEALPVVSPVAPVKVNDSQSAMAGFDHAYKISGFWHISNINEKSKDLDVDSDTYRSTSNFAFTYLKHLGNDVWLGPYLAYALTNSNTDGSGSSTKEWRPGMEFRKVFTTKGNGYIAPSLQAGWAFGGQSVDTTDGEISSSINGFNYGVGLSLGNRVGENDAYIIESGISYTRSSLTGEITQGAENWDLATTVGRFAFGISIGKLF